MTHPCILGPDGTPCGTFIGPTAPWGPGNCYLCYQYATDPKVREAWGGEPLERNVDRSKWPLAARLAARLRRPGDLGVGDTVAHSLKWLGADTLAAAYKTITGRDCGCADRQLHLNELYPYDARQDFAPGGPDKGPPPKKGVARVERPGRVRHLLYHLFPCKLYDGGAGWRWNVDQLKRRWQLFNGRKIISIAVDNNTEAREARKAFADLPGAEVFEVDNDPALREMASFDRLFSSLAGSVGLEDAVFFAHGKGVTGPGSDPARQGKANLRWTENLYETSLDYWPLVAERLKTNAAAGSLKRQGSGYWKRWESTVGDWIYAGSFYWVRGDVLRKPDWKRADRFWGGIETWPSLHVHTEDAGLLFYQFTGEGMYDPLYWERTVDPAYALWKGEHAGYRRDPLLLTCVLVSHKKPNLVREAIASVLTQSSDEWRLVIIDSGSLVRELTKEYVNDPRITILESFDGTRCQGWQINRAMSYVGGDLVCYLADDDIYDPEAFASFLAAARSNPGQDAWYGHLHRVNYSDNGTGGVYGIQAKEVGGAGGVKLRGHADGMQVCHRTKVECPWPEGEEIETRRQADGIFLDSMPVAIHPIPAVIGTHRFTKESAHEQRA